MTFSTSAAVGVACSSSNPGAPDESPFSVADAAGLNASNLDGAACVVADASLGTTCRSSSNGYVQVAVGKTYACVLAKDGGVSCWIDVDPLGLPANLVGREQPPGSFASLDVGASNIGEYACGIGTDQAIHCWGPAWRVFGDMPITPLPPGPFASVRTGASDDNGIVCGLRPDASLACWGLGVQEGHLPSSQPGPFRDVSVGNDDWGGDQADVACAVRADGTVSCWPDYAHPLVPPSGTFSAIDSKNACGIRTDGSVTCWGRWFQCDAADSTCTAIPAGAFRAIATNSQIGCGLRTDGTIACWGATSLLPPPPSGIFTSIGVGWERACAVDAQGYLVCWGRVFSMP
jgi:hypothetical protein